ncbi:MAG: hypothetical protein KC933_10620 [Myxococcales bacterium]|nr:hypothetical protein [Myxococcales bacterium]MCB9646183.1 hypothetical protein [Deltaproteobacteria bacterium]
MASNTKQTESIRKNKNRSQGKQRKKDLEKKGTTPSPSVLFAKTDAQ